MACVVVDIYGFNMMLAYSKVIISYAVFQFFQRGHVDGCRQFSIMVITQERAGRKCCRINKQCAQSGQESRKGKYVADLYIRAGWRHCLELALIVCKRHRCAKQACG